MLRPPLAGRLIGAMTPPEPTGSEDPPPSREHLGSRTPEWTRVGEVFHEVLELDPEQWDSFLAKIREREPGLADEVRSLLSAHEASGSFLDTPPIHTARTASPGDRIGPYRILEQIGR